MLAPELLVAGVMALALIIYTLGAGADFGAGVWDLLARGPTRHAQRAVIGKALGPIWEANHVWLILIVVLLFVCFPAAHAAIATALHVPLTLVLIGVVLRGSAYVFQHYDTDEHGVAARRWERVFAIASLVTPLALGVTLGALAGGIDRDPATGLVRTDFISAWLAPDPLAVGLFTLALFAHLAAVYLLHEPVDPSDLVEPAPTTADGATARDGAPVADHARAASRSGVVARATALVADDVRAAFRRRALASGLLVGLTALLAFLAADRGAPRIHDNLAAAAWALPLHLLTGAAALTALVALWRRRDGLARVAAMLQAALIVSGWALAHYPYLAVPGYTITGAAAPPHVLWPVLAALAAGALLLVPALAYLFFTFKRR